jgi:hypothetical protein
VIIAGESRRRTWIVVDGCVRPDEDLDIVTNDQVIFGRFFKATATVAVAFHPSVARRQPIQNSHGEEVKAGKTLGN